MNRGSIQKTKSGYASAVESLKRLDQKRRPRRKKPSTRKHPKAAKIKGEGFGN